MSSLLNFEEKYKKDLDFIKLVLNDSIAWEGYYGREIDYTQEKIELKKGYLEDFFEHTQWNSNSSETTRLELRQLSEEIELLEKDISYLIEEKIYWKGITEKWKKELEIETEKQK